MAVDKELFLYDLAIVAIMRNEAAYVEEWLEYHLAAGVDHFFIFDNESPDNFKEVLQPYIDAEIVTYEFYPGRGVQCEVYMEAVKKYRFFCRYMAFIDADEFIFPKDTDKSIVEVVDEILDEQEPEKRGGLEISWMMYGSNNLEAADYSKGVLERFTRRAENITADIVKTVADPRKIDYMHTPHFMIYFFGSGATNLVVIKKESRILVNHYSLRSREEYEKKIGNSAAYGTKYVHTVNKFTHEQNNDVFDDSILSYFNARKAKNIDKKRVDNDKVLKTVMKVLDPILKKNLSDEVFNGNMETFLTCLKLTEYLEEKKSLNEGVAKNLRAIILHSLILALVGKPDICGFYLLFSELPNILTMDSPAVEKIRESCIKIIPAMKKILQSTIQSTPLMMRWRDFRDLDNLYRMLKVLDYYQHK